MGRPLIPIIGKRFGRLVVWKRVKDRYNGIKNRHSEAWFLVRCDCGQEIEMRGYMLRHKRVHACQTCSPKGFRHGLSKTREYAIWNSASARAKELKLFFSLKPSDIFIPKKCPLLGIRLRINNTRTSSNSPSLDRINPKRGYTKKNVWVVSQKANTIKSNASLKELKTLIENLEKKICPSSI